jgi:hypothetical protein
MMHERYYGRIALTRAPRRARGPHAHPQLKSLRLLAFAIVAAVAGGCASGPTFSQGIYDDGIVRYRVGDPGSDWERVEVMDNDRALAFHHDGLGATVSVNSTCTDYEDVPEEALLNHLLFGMRERVFRVDETVSLDGRGALHAVVDVELDGVPLTLEVYLVKKDGCVYDLSLIASRPAFERARDALTRLVARFQVIATNLE